MFLWALVVMCPPIVSSSTVIAYDRVTGGFALLQCGVVSDHMAPSALYECRGVSAMDERGLGAEHVDTFSSGTLSDGKVVVDVGNIDCGGVLAQSDRVALPVRWGTNQSVLEALVCYEGVVQVLWCPYIPVTITPRKLLDSAVMTTWAESNISHGLIHIVVLGR
jgi:hypothetical protein